MDSVRLFTAVLLFSLSAAAGAADRSKAPKEAYAYIISPSDGETVPARFVVRFGLNGVGVAPAGVEREHTGHHHLLIDVEDLPPMDEPLPASDNIVHFGKGQTETLVELAPGKHTLQLLLGNHLHVPHYPPVKSERITINVMAPPTAPESEKKPGIGGLFK